MTAIAGTPKLLRQENEYLRAEIERLQRTNAELLTVLKSIERTANQAAVMHSPEESKP